MSLSRVRAWLGIATLLVLLLLSSDAIADDCAISTSYRLCAEARHPTGVLAESEHYRVLSFGASPEGASSRMSQASILRKPAINRAWGREGEAVVRYFVPNGARYRVGLVDIQGRLVASADGMSSDSGQEQELVLRDRGTGRLRPGLYFVVLSALQQDTKKRILIVR